MPSFICSVTDLPNFIFYEFQTSFLGSMNSAALCTSQHSCLEASGKCFPICLRMQCDTCSAQNRLGNVRLRFISVLTDLWSFESASGHAEMPLYYTLRIACLHSGTTTFRNTICFRKLTGSTLVSCENSNAVGYNAVYAVYSSLSALR
jgi:hypothetical protein